MDGVLFRCLHECVTIYLCERFRKNNTYPFTISASVCECCFFGYFNVYRAFIAECKYAMRSVNCAYPSSRRFAVKKLVYYTLEDS